mgnify:CR=1 FL=1
MTPEEKIREIESMIKKMIKGAELEVERIKQEIKEFNKDRRLFGDENVDGNYRKELNAQLRENMTLIKALKSLLEKCEGDQHESNDNS